MAPYDRNSGSNKTGQAALPHKNIQSANLSYHGQEGNIEMGVHIVSEDIAKQIDGVLTTLLFKKVFEEV